MAKKNTIDLQSKKAGSIFNKKMDEKEKRIKAYRKEVTRRASMANKRLRRLEGKGMTSAPAYENWADSGGEYFSIKGKSYNEVQSEMARINKYLDSATSSISGANKVVKEMIKNTGAKMEFDDLKDVQNQSKKFFGIASQIEQYMRTVEDRASSIGYQKIWNAINRYTKEVRSDILKSEKDVSQISADIIKAMKEWEKPEYINHQEDEFDYSLKGWFKLSKD